MLGIASNLLGTELEVSTSPEAEGVDTVTAFQLVTVHSFHDLVVDLLAVRNRRQYPRSRGWRGP